MEGGIEPDEVSVLQPARRVWEAQHGLSQLGRAEFVVLQEEVELFPQTVLLARKSSVRLLRLVLNLTCYPHAKTQKLGVGETQQIASCGLEIGAELEDGAVQLEEELEELAIEAGVVVLVLEGEERVQQRLGDVVQLPVMLQVQSHGGEVSDGGDGGGRHGHGARHLPAEQEEGVAQRARRLAQTLRNSLRGPSAHEFTPHGLRERRADEIEKGLHGVGVQENALIPVLGRSVARGLLQEPLEVVQRRGDEEREVAEERAQLGRGSEERERRGHAHGGDGLFGERLDEERGVVGEEHVLQRLVVNVREGALRREGRGRERPECRRTGDSRQGTRTHE